MLCSVLSCSVLFCHQRCRMKWASR
jgi:hypothetical protein